MPLVPVRVRMNDGSEREFWTGSITMLRPGQVSLPVAAEPCFSFSSPCPIALKRRGAAVVTANRRNANGLVGGARRPVSLNRVHVDHRCNARERRSGHWRRQRHAASDPPLRCPFGIEARMQQMDPRRLETQCSRGSTISQNREPSCSYGSRSVSWVGQRNLVAVGIGKHHSRRASESVLSNRRIYIR